MNKKGFCIRHSSYFKRLDPLVSLLFAKYWINVLVVLTFDILAKSFKLYCLQRKNCQTRHAAKHYSKQEIFFDKMRK